MKLHFVSTSRCPVPAFFNSTMNSYNMIEQHLMNFKFKCEIQKPWKCCLCSDDVHWNNILSRLIGREKSHEQPKFKFIRLLRINNKYRIRPTVNTKRNILFVNSSLNTLWFFFRKIKQLKILAGNMSLINSDRINNVYDGDDDNNNVRADVTHATRSDTTVEP